MPMDPDATLSTGSLGAVADAYGLGEPVESAFVARGAMGAVSRITTKVRGTRMSWRVKRSYWNQYTEDAVRREVDFTERCRSIGIAAPRSIPRVDGRGYVLTLDDAPSGASQYRVLDWIVGETADRDDPRTIAAITGWMAGIHNLAVDPGNHAVDKWFVQVAYDWDDLADRLKQPAPDIAELISARSTDLRVLADLVNSTSEPGAVCCHTDIGADNLIWSGDGPQLIDWEDAGPLVPHQELGCFIRSIGSLGATAYRAYRRTGGPAEITDPTHLASSVAVHLNYLVCQSELLLDDSHPEQHDFARAQAGAAAHNPPTIRSLEELVTELND